MDPTPVAKLTPLQVAQLWVATVSGLTGLVALAVKPALAWRKKRALNRELFELVEDLRTKVELFVNGKIPGPMHGPYEIGLPASKWPLVRYGAVKVGVIDFRWFNGQLFVSLSSHPRNLPGFLGVRD